MKASTSSDGEGINQSTLNSSQVDVSAAEDDEMTHASGSSIEGEGEASTLFAQSQSEEGSGNNKAKVQVPDAPATEEEAEKGGESSKASNLIGKINNLASTDLNNITAGREFLYAGKRNDSSI